VDRYRFILGSLIVGTLVVLAVAIALGHVEEKTSYGLVPVVTILAKVALDFSEWAFRPRDNPEAKDNAGDK
jgi:O-antigen ligase